MPTFHLLVWLSKQLCHRPMEHNIRTLLFRNLIPRPWQWDCLLCNLKLWTLCGKLSRGCCWDWHFKLFSFPNSGFMFYLNEKQKNWVFLQNSINLTSFTQPLKSYCSGNTPVSYSVHICTRNISSPSQVPLEKAALLLSRQHHSNGIPENQ